jgi:hypothetical protein
MKTLKKIWEYIILLPSCYAERTPKFVRPIPRNACLKDIERDIATAHSQHFSKYKLKSDKRFMIDVIIYSCFWYAIVIFALFYFGII